MTRVLFHEIEHMTEESGTYKQLASTILQAVYEDDNITFDDILSKVKNGEELGRLAADILATKKTYEDTLGKKTWLNDEYVLREIVADGMGKLMNGDQELIDRIAKKDPSALRRIIEAVKSFLKKAVGIKGDSLTTAQRAVDMMEAALKENQESRQQRADENLRQMNGQDENGMIAYPDGPIKMTDWTNNMDVQITGMKYDDQDGVSFVTTDGFEIPATNFEGGTNSINTEEGKRFSEWATEQAEKVYQNSKQDIAATPAVTTENNETVAY
jgi:hypothetical protein